MYLGLKAGTEGMKALLIDVQRGCIVSDTTVNYGTDLPLYLSPKGSLPSKDPLVRETDPLMWLDALDLILKRLAARGVDLSGISAVSGSGQPHSAVFLNAGFDEALDHLDSRRTLSAQLSGTLSRLTSPNKLDASTTEACRELTARFGRGMQETTGSTATECFTGPQIRKFAQACPSGYAATARIHLAGSFLCSVLCGKSAPVDYGDGAGMNLLNLHTLAWDEAITSFTAPNLIERLPPTVPASTVVGGLSPYFAQYGLEPGVPVVVWSGDAPDSLVGSGASQPGTAVFLPGLVTTFLAAMASYSIDPAGDGHVFGNPIGGFMGQMDFPTGAFGREGDRSVWESQVRAIRSRVAWMGRRFEKMRIPEDVGFPPRLVQLLADVFQTPVERICGPDAAALGSAMRAAVGMGGCAYPELDALFCRKISVSSPHTC